MAYDDERGFRGRKAVVRYGQPGHEHEFCVNVSGYDFDDYIPEALSDAVKEALPHAFHGLLLNRGTRLEYYAEPEQETELVVALEAAGLRVVADVDYDW